MALENKPDLNIPIVLYIMGTGRSGSTMLEILLGSAPDTFAAGELFNVLEDGYSGDAMCSCGNLFSFCNVWSKVKLDVPLNNSEIEDLSIENRRIEWHSGFWRQWSGLLRPSTLYGRFNVEVFRSLANISGAAYVIDSSKYAGRALAINSLLDKRLRIIWLVRNASGILHSFQKPNKDEQHPRSAFSSTLYIIFVTLCAWLVKRKMGGRCLIVQYEKLLTNPTVELERIGEWASIDLNEAIRRVENMEEFEIGHLVTGNRLRKQGKLMLDTAHCHPDLDGTLRSYASVLNWWYRLLGIHE